MRRAFIPILVSLLFASLSNDVFGQKNKVKSKSFEPSARATLKEYQGTYTGIDGSYFIEIVALADGKLLIKSFEGDRVATLQDIRIEGPAIYATKVYADGETGTFQGVFANRNRNGQRAFGIIVDGLQMNFEGLLLESLFYRLKENVAINSTGFVDTDASVVRREIEARYVELAFAVNNKDFDSFQALRTEDFASWLQEGDIQHSEQMAARAKAMLSESQFPINLINQVESVVLIDGEAIAMVNHAFSRMEEISGQVRLIEIRARHRDTWVRTADGWKLQFVGSVGDERVFVDGVEIETMRVTEDAVTVPA
jgi:ketosteroid isomerase-like protein